jgi:glucosyl-dolichyl phosphate glucuronosyltransferase
MPTHEIEQPAPVRLLMTIVIGTLNRRVLLQGSLVSLLRQRCPADRFEILVVDNGSTDGTQDMVRRMAAAASNMRLIEEPARGLSHARNRGIAEARGGLIAFFDDDAVAEPDWVEVLLRIFELEPETDAAGGRIEVLWPDTRPIWMPRSIEGYYGRCDYGDERKRLAYPQYPYGSNMVIRRERLLAIGGFNTELGPTGGNLMAGGEQDVFFRLYEANVTVVYEPAALVHHWAPPERVTRHWTRRRAFRHGISNATMAYWNGAVGLWPWVGRLAVAISRMAKGAAGIITALLGRAAPDVVVARTATTLYWAGIARGALTNAFRRAH